MYSSFRFVSSSLLPVLLSLTLLFPPTISTSRHALLDQPDAIRTGFQTPMRHVDSGKNFSAFQLLRRAIKRGRGRIGKLHEMSLVASEPDIGSPVHAGGRNGEYFVDLWVGNPPVSFSAVVDTGSDLVWTQCKPCKQCFNQTTPVFDPTMSFSFSSLPCSNFFCSALPSSSCNIDGSCNYTYNYADYSSTKGAMGLETLIFSNFFVQNVVFGCGSDNPGIGLDQGSGIVGLGRGTLSLVSQLEEPIFSYCLTPIDSNKTSMLKMGSFAQVSSFGLTYGYRTTPLIRNPSSPSLYYLSLQGITVGQKRLPIRVLTSAMREDGSGGMFIDSGTTLTYLEQGSFDLMKQEFISQTNLSVSQSYEADFDLCFDVGSNGRHDIQVPRLVFHFDGLDLDLPEKNYMITDGDGALCLAMAGTPSDTSVLGNFQQQDMLVVHDLGRETIAFIPAECDQI